MDAAHLLAEIVAQKTPVPVSYYGSDRAFSALMKVGFINETSVMQSVNCDECNDPHSAEIVYDAGNYGFHCPDLGFIKNSAPTLL